MNAPVNLPEAYAIPDDESPVPASDEDLRWAITKLAGHINAAEHRFLKLLFALVERGAWHGAGFKSPAHWLNYSCGIDLGAAREKVRVAKCLNDLPLISEAFRRGEISYSKVRAMTRAATPDNEDYLLYIARQGTAQHIELLVSKYQRVRRISAEGRERSRRQYDSRQLHWHIDDDGMMVINARLTPEDGAAFLKSLEAFQDTLYSQPPVEESPTNDRNSHDASASTDEVPEHVFAETPDPGTTHPQKRADALARMADQALANLDGGLTPASAADKYQVMVHLERSKDRGMSNRHDVSAETSVHHGLLEYAGSHIHLSPDALKRLACDASLVSVEEDEQGNVLNIGRRTRTVPPAIRRALTLRDAHCRFPGCCQTKFLDAHHIRHWCHGGETRLDNLILLCRHHHRVLHQEGYRITRDSTGKPVFITPAGRPMPDALSPQFTEGEDAPGQPAAIEAEHERLGLNIDAETAVTSWKGESMDYALAVGALLEYDE